LARPETSLGAGPLVRRIDFRLAGWKIGTHYQARALIFVYHGFTMSDRGHEKSAGKPAANRLSSIVANSLDTPAKTEELARQAYQSRTQFHRLFRTVIQETPAAMRRRLLLERAAYQLAHTAASVTDIALDANYGSLEAFTRAFRKAFRTSPSLYRRMRDLHFHLPAPNKIHFLAPGSPTKGEKDMDLFDRFAGNDSWHTRRLLEYAATLTDEQLDKPLPTVVELLPWREANKTLRQLLENIIFTKEVWTAALAGGSIDVNGPPPSQRSPKAMLQRLEKTDVDLHRILGDVRNRAAWDDTFVDALCEPAETFTFGGVFAHIMTFNAHRRLMALYALRQLGVQTEGFGDPMEYEESVAPWNKQVAAKTP
jgi:AraC family transcriptional regulator